MKKYKAFSINFITKGYILKKDNEHKIKGIAYYVIDDNYKIIKQFAQILEATFRPTDIEMKKTKGHYLKKSKIIELRKKYLEKYQMEKNYDPNKISKKDNYRLKLPNEIISSLNLELLKLNRVKTSISLFIGSNPSGAETNNKASNIITFGNQCDYIDDGLNFSNPLNRKEIFENNENIIINSINDIELIDVKDFFDKNKVAKKLFEEYNYSKHFVFEDIDKDNINIDEIYSKLVYSDEILDNKIKFRKNNKSECFWSKIDDLIKDYSEIKKCCRNEDKIKMQLRKYQKILIKQEIDNLLALNPNLPKDYFYEFIENKNSSNSKYCHIIPVRESIKNDKTLFEIVDNNNCLLLSPNLHEEFDKFKIIFDDNGCCFDRKQNIISGWKLKKEILSKKRKEYLKRYMNQCWPHKK